MKYSSPRVIWYMMSDAESWALRSGWSSKIKVHRREIKCLLLKFLHLKLMQTLIMLRGKVKILLDLAQYLDRNN